jgi:hypothetical protein
MKFFFLTIFFLTNNLLYSQTSDTTACRKIEDSLRIVERFLNDHNSDSSMKRISAVIFLTSLTGIKSQSPIDYLGQHIPVKDDYKLWLAWYEANKLNVFWDPCEKKVRVRSK